MPGSITTRKYHLRSELISQMGALRGGIGNRPGQGGKVSLRALYGLVSGRGDECAGDNRANGQAGGGRDGYGPRHTELLFPSQILRLVKLSLSPTSSPIWNHQN